MVVQAGQYRLPNDRCEYFAGDVKLDERHNHVVVDIIGVSNRLLNVKRLLLGPRVKALHDNVPRNDIGVEGETLGCLDKG